MGISVGVASPGTISSVGVAHPGVISSVGNSNGTQTVSLVPPRTTGSTTVYSGGGGGYAAPAPVYAPRLDIAAVNAQARTAAENAVNPFYTKTLNDFLAGQATLKAQRETQAATDIKNLQDALKETQEANALTGTRTTEDTATKEGLIATAQDQNQVDTGNKFETDRLAAAKAQAVAGVLGSGAGNRETNTLTTDRNTTEGRQNATFQAQKDAQELFKSRTFEDLATSNKLAGEKEVKGEAQTKFDLNSYIQNLGEQEKQQRNTLEEQRLQRIAQETQNQSKLAFTRYLAGISNPAQYEAAVRTYGGSF